MAPKLSVIIPVFNERASLDPLLGEIRSVLANVPHEIVLVDDGSTDGSREEILRLSRGQSSVRAIFLARNFGQTAALAAGFKDAAGEIIVPMDGDGQNDPRDIPLLVRKISEGFDVASGWRQRREDPFWSRRLPSGIANRIIAWVSGVPLHDFGCTLKAYRRSALENVRLYGEMHRLLPVWCASRGARITEVPVGHRPRRAGHSKYGIGRTFKVLLDLMTTKFMSGYLGKPSYVFGGIAFVLFGLGLVSAALVFYDKLGPDRYAHLRIPGLLLTCFLGIVGTMLFMMGLLAELLVRIYYEVAHESPYQLAPDAASASADSK